MNIIHTLYNHFIVYNDTVLATVLHASIPNISLVKMERAQPQSRGLSQVNLVYVI